MSKSYKKKYFTAHTKSSAALISLALHAVIIVVALSFVAVTVINKDEQQFEAKPVSRPKMQLKKLQVPINIKKKKTQKPKLRKRIVVQPKMNKNMPDIKMPEITGIKGGLGNAAGTGLGGGAGIGFTMPEFEIFGVKGKGEKVFLILDAGPKMMYDEMGGIPAYSIIKQELARIVEELPPTALFNLAVYERGTTHLLFSKMVPANDVNLRKVEAWLEPLNAVKKSSQSWGVRTLGSGGERRDDDVRVGPFVRDGEKVGSMDTWFRSTLLAMQMQADTVFILGHFYGTHRYALNAATHDKWKGSAAEKKWNECYKKGLAKLDAENKKRKAAGQPIKVLERNIWAINKEYYPGIQRPPQPEWQYFTTKDFVNSFHVMRAQHATKNMPVSSGLGRKKKPSRKDFSLNVVYFCKAGDESGGGGFKALAKACNGDIAIIEGLEAIKSHVVADSE